MDVNVKIPQSYSFPCLGKSPDLSVLSQPMYRLRSAAILLVDTSLVKASLTNFSAIARYFELLAWRPSESHSSIRFSCILTWMKFQWVPLGFSGMKILVAHTSWHPVTPPSYCRKVVLDCWVCVPKEFVH